jgi:outer membrane protein
MASLAAAALLGASRAALAQAAPPAANPMAVPIQQNWQGGGGGGGAAPAPTIMVVDADRILQQSKASQSIQSQISAQEQAYQKELTAKQNELDTEQSELVREQHTMPVDQFDDKRHAFSKKVEDMQKEVESRKRALQQAAAEAIEKLKRKFVEVVNGVAQERHSNMVLLRSALVISDPAYDVTDVVAQRLDQAITTIPVVFSAATPVTQTGKN